MRRKILVVAVLVTAVVSASLAFVTETSPKFGQCGGTGWTGPTTCEAGSTCTYASPFYSQCL
jgi:hypothetical protein